MRLSTGWQKDVPNVDLLILVQALNLQAMHKQTGSIVCDVATMANGSFYVSFKLPWKWFHRKMV